MDRLTINELPDAWYYGETGLAYRQKPEEDGHG